jgi:hypothetical protein
MHFKVRNGQRILEFDGQKLSHASSEKPDSDRWVEFTLYFTNGGSYVLERVGQTVIFHRNLGCEVVERNKLRFDSEYELQEHHQPCQLCDPDEYNDLLIIEKPRFYALVTDDPAAIIKSLHKLDANGLPYMTKVAERLLEEASEIDKRLERAYRIQYID